MARPKKSDRDSMATVRIEDAFWKLLEELDYSDITVLRVSQESGTNRNSFYYHYKDIDDLAQSAFIHNIDEEVSQGLFSVLFKGFGDNTDSPNYGPELLIHSKRIMLCARSNSVFLNHLVKDLLKQVWFNAFNVDESGISLLESLQVDFIFSGLVSVLGSTEVEKAPWIMTDLSNTELGKAAINTIKNLSNKA